MQNRNTLFWAILAIWALAYAASLWALFVLEPSGDGFTRGLNRLSSFVGWQILAATLALIVWLLARPWASGLIRWIARLPGLLAIALIGLIVGVIIWAQFKDHTPPASPPPPKPVTSPAD